MNKCHIVKNHNTPSFWYCFLLDVRLVLVEIYHFHSFEFPFCFIDKVINFYKNGLFNHLLVDCQMTKLSVCEDFPDFVEVIWVRISQPSFESFFRHCSLKDLNVVGQIICHIIDFQIESSAQKSGINFRNGCFPIRKWNSTQIILGFLINASCENLPVSPDHQIPTYWIFPFLHKSIWRLKHVSFLTLIVRSSVFHTGS